MNGWTSLSLAPWNSVISKVGLDVGGSGKGFSGQRVVDNVSERGLKIYIFKVFFF